MKIKEIAFVCCAVSDLSRARGFYEGVLGLKPNAPVSPDPYYIEYDVGAEHSQSNATRIGPFLPTACQSHLKSTILRAALRHLGDHGIAFFLGPTETKVCHWAAFRDPDGNRLVIHKRK